MAFNLTEFAREWWNRVTVPQLTRERIEQEHIQCDVLAEVPPCGRLADDQSEKGDAFQLNEHPPDC